ncbi:MAG: radical SAM domain-containing protein [Solirubrobacteraceae bacterium]
MRLTAKIDIGDRRPRALAARSLALLVRRARALELTTRPVPPDLEQALQRRWEELPEHVKTSAQALGRRMGGCEGTHGVFPRCNLACTPCYHAREANRVRVDGAHTLAEVDAQMALLHTLRGPGQHAQLIGGEVTLLAPEDHARVLATMRRHARKPMSMSHGDFDYDYLLALALGADGRPRSRHLSFAGHFDSMMFGRRGLRRARSEAELNVHRRRFCEMFGRLEREHGISHYLAHNMTVTPGNVGQVAQVIRDCRDYGFRMFSFQPAAFVGNPARWKDDYRACSGDEVWAQIEAGAGCRLCPDVFQVGDPRCNRTVHAALVGERCLQLLDPGNPRDLELRDAFYEAFGGMDFEVAAPLLAARLTRAVAPHPRLLALAAGWARRFVRRAGGIGAVRRHGVRPVTFVMHSFMDARVVAPAWELMQAGEAAQDPEVRAAQERLAACSYAMAHPETGELVPACVQHAVLDPQESAELARLLPLAPAPSA